MNAQRDLACYNRATTSRQFGPAESLVPASTVSSPELRLSIETTPTEDKHPLPGRIKSATSSLFRATAQWQPWKELEWRAKMQG